MYYVYIHKRKDNGVPFYVGKGKKDRVKIGRQGKPKEWVAIVENAGGFDFEILEYFEDENQALLRENEYISNPPDYWKLINKSKNSSLDYQIHWESYLKLDSDSPSGLSCKLTGEFRGSKKFYSNGEPQEWSIRLFNKSYRAHRIIAVLLGHELSRNMAINHIDNNPHNNSISNLEICTQKQNMGLTKRHVSPDINFCISEENHSKFDTKMNKTYLTQYAKVRITVSGVRKSKRFSYNTYGKEQAWELARIYRDGVLSKLLENKETLPLNKEKLR